jgi:hypothetical protein
MSDGSVELDIDFDENAPGLEQEENQLVIS